MLIQVVPKDVARTGVPSELIFPCRGDHNTMVQFETSSNHAYQRVESVLVKIVRLSAARRGQGRSGREGSWNAGDAEAVIMRPSDQLMVKDLSGGLSEASDLPGESQPLFHDPD